MLTRTMTLLVMLMMALPAAADRKLDGLIKKHRYQKAFKYIEKKFPPEKRNLDTWIKAGTISEGLGKSEKALGCYLAIVRKDQKNVEALRSLVRLYSRMEYYPNAYTMVRQLLNIKEKPKEQTKKQEKQQNKTRKTTFEFDKNKNFSEWYTEIVQKAELADLRSNVKGFVVFQPWSVMAMEKMYDYMEKTLQKKARY